MLICAYSNVNKVKKNVCNCLVKWYTSYTVKVKVTIKVKSETRVVSHALVGLGITTQHNMKKSTIIKDAKRAQKQASRKQASRKASTKQVKTSKASKASKASTKQVKARKARSSGLTFVQGAKDYGTVKQAKIFGARAYDLKHVKGAEIKQGDIVKAKYGYSVAACNVKDVQAEIVKFKRNGYAKLKQGETVKGVNLKAGTKVEIMKLEGSDDYGRKGENIVHGCMTYLAARIKRGGKWLTFGAEVNRWHKVETVLVDLIKA